MSQKPMLKTDASNQVKRVKDQPEGRGWQLSN